MAKRLLKERKAFEDEPLDYVLSVDVVDENLHHWHVSLKGPDGTPYADGTFVLDVAFPDQYPFKPPTITFKTPIYHPSVKVGTGEICADILNMGGGEGGSGWRPTITVKSCVELIYQQLKEPNADHFVEEEIASLLRDKPKEFEKKALKHTKEHAM